MAHLDPETSPDALRLRAWAWAALAGERGQTEPPPASEETWTAFLSTEGVAVILCRLALSPPPPLSNAATVEAQRVLSGRLQLTHLGEIATRAGVPLVILKGGGHLDDAEGGLSVADLDVLVHPDHLERVLPAFESAGYRPRSRDIPGGRHLAPRFGPGGLRVEIHTAIEDDAGLSCDELFAGSREVDGKPGLRRPAAHHHAWHALVHAVVEHPHRRGRLRDVVLLRRALADCDAAQEAWVADQARAHRAAAALLLHLEMARGATGDDPGRGVAALNYSLVTQHIARLPSKARYAVADAAAVRLFPPGGPREPRRRWREIGRPGIGLAWGGRAGLARLAPGVAGAGRALLRVGWHTLAGVAGAALARRFRTMPGGSSGPPPRS